MGKRIANPFAATKRRNPPNGGGEWSGQQDLNLRQVVVITQYDSDKQPRCRRGSQPKPAEILTTLWLGRRLLPCLRSRLVGERKRAADLAARVLAGRPFGAWPHPPPHMKFRAVRARANRRACFPGDVCHASHNPEKVHACRRRAATQPRATGAANRSDKSTSAAREMA
jgi:hypothetical protein